MNRELPNLERIEDYLNGLMSEEETALFETELTRNPALKKEYNIVKDMLMGVELLGDDLLKAQISNAHQGLKQDGFFEKKTAKLARLEPAKRRVWRRLAVAASLLVAVSAALFFWLNQRDPYQQFFKHNFYAEDVKIATVIDDLSASGLLTGDRDRRISLVNALKFYQSEDFPNAQSALSFHHQNYPQDTIAQFYLALSSLHLSDYDNAIALLQPVATDVFGPDSQVGQVSSGRDFEQEITWYLALAYSKRSDQASRDSTLLLLRRLESNGNDLYSSKAREALKLLE